MEIMDRIVYKIVLCIVLVGYVIMLMDYVIVCKKIIGILNVKKVSFIFSIWVCSIF